MTKESFSILVVSFPALAEPLIKVAKRIVSSTQDVAFLAVPWDADVDQAHKELEEKLASLAPKVLILTDMFGSTPANLSIKVYKADCVEVITGVNLPMMVKALTLVPGLSLSAAASQLMNQARNAIRLAHGND